MSNLQNVKLNVSFNDEERIERMSLNMGITYLISLRGSCQRAKVAAIILQDNRIISTGYNGPLMARNCKSECDINKPCTHSVHAEANAIAAASKHGVRLENASMYCLYTPCINCANLIIQSGIREFIYWKEYRDLSGLDLLMKSGIDVKQYGL